MSEAPIDPLPPALAALFEREAKSPLVEDAVAKAKVLHRVSRALDFALPSGAPTPAAPTATTFTAAKVAVLVAIAFVGGGTLGAAVMWRATRHPSPPPVLVATSSAVVAPASPGRADVAATPSSVAVGDLPTSATPQPVNAASTSAPAPATDSGLSSLTREREVVDAARAALVHGRYDDVLRAVHRHETQWPHGALEEEREALAIQALAASGRRAAAETRAARFRRDYPGSMLGDVVNAALAPASP